MSALDGQIALVTGSTRGIGGAIAAEFAKPGSRVIVSPAGFAGGDLIYPYDAARQVTAR